MQFSPNIDLLCAGLVKAQAEIKSIPKDGRNPDFNSKYTTLDAIMEHVRPVLAKHGLALSQGLSGDYSTAAELVVETVLIHVSGQWISNVVRVPLKGRRLRGSAQFGEADAQSAGAALTYARRYGVSAILGLASDDDDDGNAVTPKPQRAATARPVADYPAQATAAPQSAGVPQGAIAARVAPSRERGESLPVDTTPPKPPRACPKCQSALIIDVRGQKKTPKSPDFRCEVCGTGIWARRSTVARAAVVAGGPPDAPPPDEPPPDLFP